MYKRGIEINMELMLIIPMLPLTYYSNSIHSMLFHIIIHIIIISSHIIIIPISQSVTQSVGQYYYCKWFYHLQNCPRMSNKNARNSAIINTQTCSAIMQSSIASNASKEHHNKSNCLVRKYIPAIKSN
jgi:hypothetical protein